jgi:hypothetical protein
MSVQKSTAWIHVESFPVISAPSIKLLVSPRFLLSLSDPSTRLSENTHERLDVPSFSFWKIHLQIELWSVLTQIPSLQNAVCLLHLWLVDSSSQSLRRPVLKTIYVPGMLRGGERSCIDSREDPCTSTLFRKTDGKHFDVLLFLFFQDYSSSMHVLGRSRTVASSARRDRKPRIPF